MKQTNLKMRKRDVGRYGLPVINPKSISVIDCFVAVEILAEAGVISGREGNDEIARIMNDLFMIDNKNYNNILAHPRSFGLTCSLRTIDLDFVLNKNTDFWLVLRKKIDRSAGHDGDSSTAE